MSSPRSRANARSRSSIRQARTELLTEARSLIFRARSLDVDAPAGLFTIQHEIERELGNERRNRRDIRRSRGEQVTEVNQSAGTATNGQSPGGEDVAMTDDIEGEEQTEEMPGLVDTEADEEMDTDI